MSKPIADDNFTINDAAREQLGLLTHSVATALNPEGDFRKYVEAARKHNAAFKPHESDYIGDIAVALLQNLSYAERQPNLLKTVLTNSLPRLARRAESHAAIQAHIEADQELSPRDKHSLLMTLDRLELALKLVERLSVRELANPGNYTSPYATAHGRWVKALGLQPSQEPVSMAGTTTTRKTDGTLQVGG